VIGLCSHKDLQYRSRTPSAATTLLFYRTICDIGLALRFICGPLVDLRMCGEVICDMQDLQSDSEAIERACNAPAAILEFFEIASEAWFLCMAIDLAITLMNPFSPFRKRLLLLLCISPHLTQDHLLSSLQLGISWTSCNSCLHHS
jgi:hypothetical protein